MIMVGFILGTPGGNFWLMTMLKQLHPCSVCELDEEKSTHAPLAPQIGFEPAFLQSLLHDANPFPPPLPTPHRLRVLLLLGLW
jgi:hypothetical protein